MILYLPVESRSQPHLSFWVSEGGIITGGHEDKVGLELVQEGKKNLKMQKIGIVK